MAHDDFPISEKYYTPITCFLTFNLSAVLGNLIPSILRFVSIDFIFYPIVLQLKSDQRYRSRFMKQNANFQISILQA